MNGNRLRWTIADRTYVVGTQKSGPDVIQLFSTIKFQ